MPSITIESETNVGTYTLHAEYSMDTELTKIKEFVKLIWSENVTGNNFYFSFNNNIISLNDEEKTLQELEEEYNFKLDGYCKFKIVN